MALKAVKKGAGLRLYLDGVLLLKKNLAVERHRRLRFLLYLRSRLVCPYNPERLQ